MTRSHVAFVLIGTAAASALALLSLALPTMLFGA